MEEPRDKSRVEFPHLTANVGEWANACISIEASSSIRRAVEVMQEHDQEWMAVVADGVFGGVIDTHTILIFVAEGGSDLDSVANLAVPIRTIDNTSTAATALRQFNSGDTRLAVVNAASELVGMLTPSSFLGRPPLPERPHPVGGMATPFGVYLTSGAAWGGKGGFNLVLTGVCMFGFFLISRVIELIATPYVPATPWVLNVLAGAPILAMVLIFRLLPIAGYHAAEHQVVHALERQEPLVPEVVARMPRVHPRCGTNLAVAISVFLTIQQSPWARDIELRTLTAALVTLTVWRPIGSWTQYWITTRPAKPHQIKSAIDAANDLISRHGTAARRTVNPAVRLLRSGMFHVMAGSLIAYGVASLIALIFGVELGTL